MSIEIELTDAHMGYITAAIQRERQMRSTTFHASHGGAYRQIKPTDKPTPAAMKFQAVEALWNPVLHRIYAPRVGGGTPEPLAPTKPPPPPPTLPNHLGPFNWNPIGFHGTDCHGEMSCTLFSNGGYSFSGNFNDPDIYDLDDALVFSIVSSTGILYLLSHKGSMHGWGDRWLEGGSDNDGWNDQGQNAALQAGWADLCAGYRWSAYAAVNFDIGHLIDEVEAAIKAVEKVIQVVEVVAAAF